MGSLICVACVSFWDGGTRLARAGIRQEITERFATSYNVSAIILTVPHSGQQATAAFNLRVLPYDFA